MTSTTRRGILSTIALAAPAVALGALPAIAGAGQADAELFKLERALTAAYARWQAATEVTNDAEERYLALKPPAPVREKLPAELAKLYDQLSIKDIARGNNPIDDWDREHEARFDERRAVHEAECQRLRDEMGVDAADAAQEAAWKEFEKVGDRLFATPAESFAGLLVKLRANEMLGIPEGGDNPGFNSIAADIERLATPS